jgi:DNA polymerase
MKAASLAPGHGTQRARPLPLAKPVTDIPSGGLAALRRKAASCRACPLWRYGKQTVFGKGPASAAAMLIGEQPGLQEDEAGVPFVGPAGHLLDRAMDEAGLDRQTLYLTNTVKHFKYETRGTAKLHKRANASEQAACRMWLAAELLRVRPQAVIGLGAMAAQTLFGNGFRITRERGQWRELAGDVRGMATWHPSAVLRMPEPARRQQAYAELVADLRQLVAVLAGMEP